MFLNLFQNKTVWLSGHTGFKGSWLAYWLLELGANVHGFALEPSTNPALFEQLNLSKRLNHEINDLRDFDAVKKSIISTQPDFVFHLAAQPLVRFSYEQPIETYNINVLGTVHVLEALRHLKKPCAAVFITTDKCYENREWLHSYREEDSLGGYDPYSSSKAAAEIAIASFRRSFFNQHSVKIASARAGNVIGGGDWALDRIIPDCIRALQSKQSIPVRNKVSTRPWQHVLEPISGYLWLAIRLSQLTNSSKLDSAFNFGPALTSNRTVAQLVQEVVKHWPGSWEDKSDPKAVHEARLLNLATDKAFHLLQWQPVWNFEKTIEQTVSWYQKSASSSKEIPALTSKQISDYIQAATDLQLPWTA